MNQKHCQLELPISLDVGYFNQHANLLNRFQLVLVDRSDLGAGVFDAEFNYDRIDWEAGDASGGSGGRGGMAARAGYGNGSGVVHELAGSGTAGSLLDAGTAPLIGGSQGSAVAGRYVFRFDGSEVPPVVSATGDVAVVHGLAPVQIDVLANDSDPNGYALTVTGWTQPTAGTLTFDPNTNVFTYTPNSRLASANDSFTYTISNGHGGTATAVATIQRVFWTAPAGGDWSDAANWNGGLLPTAEDDVTINLPATETITVPFGFAAQVHSLTTDARFDVAGSLLITGDSNIGGEFDVEGTVTVAVPGVVPSAAPGEELSLLPYLGTAHGLVLRGGGDVTGQIVTQSGSQTTLTSGELRLAGLGALNGDGWYSINAAALSLNGAAATVSRLFAGDGSVVGGNADLTTSVLIARGATFSGLAPSKLTNNGFSYTLAPVPAGVTPGKTINGRTWEIAQGAKEVISANITISNGGAIHNKGTVTVKTGAEVTQVAIRLGVGVGRVENDGVWNVITPTLIVEADFINHNLIDATSGSDNPRTLRFTSYQQAATLAEVDPQLYIEWADVYFGQAEIRGGSVVGSEDYIGEIHLDSALSATESARLTLSKAAGVITLSHINLNTDDESELFIEGDVLFDDTTWNLAGYTQWSGGDLMSRNGIIDNYGSFVIWGDNRIAGLVFKNHFIVRKNVGVAADATKFEMSFENNSAAPIGIVVAAGGIEFSAGGQIAGGVFIAPDARIDYLGGTTKYLGATDYNGGGRVRVMDTAVLQLVGGVTLNADRLEMVSNPNAFGFGGQFDNVSAAGESGRHGGTIEVRLGFVLEAGAIEHLDVKLLQGSVSEIRASAVAAARVFSASELQVQGQLDWRGGSITLDDSVIKISGQQAVLAINTDAAIEPFAVGQVLPAIEVGVGGELNRGAMAPVTPANVQVPVTNNGGTVVLTGLILDSFVQTTGTALLVGGGAIVATTIEIKGGSLDLGGGTLNAFANPLIIGVNGTLTGTGKIIGDVTNKGQFFVGGAATAGTVEITGKFDHSGTLTVDLGLPQVGTGYDQLKVGDKATLTGKLVVKDIQGFNQNGTDTFTVLTYGTRVGAFDAGVDGLTIGTRTLTKQVREGKIDVE